MNTLRHNLPVGLMLVAFIAFIGCDNDRAAEVPSNGSGAAEPAPAPALEVPEGPTETATDEVVVWVNGEPLKKSDVDQQLRELRSLYGTQRRPLGGQELKVKRRLITERLIDRELLDQWLDTRERPVVTTQEIDRVIADEVRKRYGNRDVLQRHLERRGATLSDYRADLQRQLQIERMLVSVDTAASSGSDAGVADTFETITARPAREVRVRAASLFVPWPPDTPRDQVEDEVIRLVTAAKSPEEFERAARKLEGRWSPDFDPDIGWTREGETAGDVARTLFSTESGHATEAISTPLGLQVFFVLERETLESAHFKRHRATLEDHLRKQQILRQRRDLIEKLRSDAVLRWNENAPPAAEVDH